MFESVSNVSEHFKLVCLHACLNQRNYLEKIKTYLREEIKSGDRADMQKVDSYICELGGYKSKGAGDALLFAASLPYADMVTHFLVNGVPPNFFNEEGRTAIMFAAHEGRVSNVKIIHAFGGRIDKKDCDGNHALFYALNSKRAAINEDVIEYLFDNSSEAELHLINKYGIELDHLVDGRETLVTALRAARCKCEKFPSLSIVG